jgi:hypothetical protein
VLRIAAQQSFNMYIDKAAIKNGWRYTAVHPLYFHEVVKVKESRNRPGMAQSVPGGLGSQISLHSTREGGEVVSPTHRPPLPPGMFLVLIFTRG